MDEGRKSGRLTSVRDLDGYNVAFEAAMTIFRISKGFPKDEKYSLTDRVRRSSRLICANLAEGWRKRKYQAVFMNKLPDAGQEAAETQICLEFALHCNYVDDDVFRGLYEKYQHIFTMIKTMEKKANVFCK